MASQTMDTQEYLPDTEEFLPTCLQIKLHHPQQSSRGLYRLLKVGSRQKHPAEDPLRIGRDGQACTFALDDSRVSRKQLAFQAYRRPNDDAEMRFSLQNLSQKGRVYVDGSVLGYLERKDLPDKALVRFLDYEVLIVRVSGEATASFEVEFEVLMTPPSREMGTRMTPVMDTGSSCHCLTNSFSSEFSCQCQGPVEADETLYQ